MGFASTANRVGISRNNKASPNRLRSAATGNYEEPSGDEIKTKHHRGIKRMAAFYSSPEVKHRKMLYDLSGRVSSSALFCLFISQHVVLALRLQSSSCFDNGVAL